MRAGLPAAALYALLTSTTYAQIAQLGPGGAPPDPNPKSARMGLERLPNATGREDVGAVCSRCHNIERIAEQRRTARQWRAMVPLMTDRLGNVADAPSEQDVP